jgi:hypothetical protein
MRVRSKPEGMFIALTIPENTLAKSPSEVTRVERTSYVEHLGEYEAAWSELATGSIPVLMPPEPERAARWSAVLDWYATRSRAAATRGLPVDCDERDAIAVLDPAYLVPASLYGALRARPVFLATSTEALLERVAQLGPRSVLLIGPLSGFSLPQLQRYGALSIPWGILPARDLPGLTFMLAKMLWSERCPVNDQAIVDATSGRIATFGTGARVEPGPAEASAPADVLGRSAWGRLALLAHGKGGHINLGHAVLCALESEHELQLDGSELAGGCQRGADGARCKRAASATQEVLHLTDVRAQQLLLFTCAGSLVPGEFYPSSISALSSLLEGYVASGFVSTGMIRIFQSEPDAAFELLRVASLASVVQLLNRTKENKEIARCPYVVVGDPAGAALAYDTLSDTASCEIAAGRCSVALELGPIASAGSVLEATPASCRLVAGPRYALAMIEPSPAPTTITIIDRKQDWTELHELVGDLSRRLAQCARTERSIWLSQQKRFARSPELLPAVRSLSLARGQLELHVAAVTERLEEMRDIGMWTPGSEQLAAELRSAMRAWDTEMGLLLSAFLHDGALTHVLRYGFRREGSRDAGSCPACGSYMEATRYEDPHEQVMTTMGTTCIACGDVKTLQYGSLPIELELPEVLVAGRPFSIAYRIDADRSTGSDAGGYLCFSVCDPVDQQVYSESFVEFERCEGCFVGELPLTARREPQRVQVALVTGLAISTYRCLIPAVPG